MGGSESNCQGSGVIIDNSTSAADGAVTAIADCVEELGNIYQKGGYCDLVCTVSSAACAWLAWQPVILTCAACSNRRRRRRSSCSSSSRVWALGFRAAAVTAAAPVVVEWWRQVPCLQWLLDAYAAPFANIVVAVRRIRPITRWLRSQLKSSKLGSMGRWVDAAAVRQSSRPPVCSAGAFCGADYCQLVLSASMLWVYLALI